jgi:hypothetical protein
MALHTLEELHSKTADIIRSLLLEGYRVVPTEQISKREFVAVLTNNHNTVKVITRCSYDHFIIIFVAKHNKDHRFDFEESRCYYKSYDNIYSDSEKEAEDERIKYITKCYEDMYLTGNFPETYTKINYLRGK